MPTPMTGDPREDASLLRVKEVICHGNYRHEREAEIPATFEGFLQFLSGSPYASGAGNRTNMWVINAWGKLRATGHSAFGWSNFYVTSGISETAP